MAQSWLYTAYSQQNEACSTFVYIEMTLVKPITQTHGRGIGAQSLEEGKHVQKLSKKIVPFLPKKWLGNISRFPQVKGTDMFV